MSRRSLISRRHFYALHLAVWALALLCPLLAWAEVVGVIFPETREPYRQVYSNIIEGIEKEYKKVEQLTVGPNTPAEAVHAWLESKDITALVVLGNECLSLIPNLSETAVVVGGTILSPGRHSYPGITLNPSPHRLFAGLLNIRPQVRDIHVVYEPEYNGWVIEEAERAAEQLDLRLHTHPVSGLRQAAAKYREIQRSMKSETGALWLPLGGPSREKSILQNILETAWTRDQIIISSNLADVRRGALYALYPNNQGMGMELAKLLKSVSPAGENVGENLGEAVFLDAVYDAINLRTAEHIGLRVSKEELKEFEFVYPPQ